MTVQAAAEVISEAVLGIIFQLLNYIFYAIVHVLWGNDHNIINIYNFE